jgi:hypothetical protein
MPHLAPSAAPQITARYPRSGHAARVPSVLAHYFGARVMVIHIFGYNPEAYIAVRFIFEPTDAGCLLTGVMFWIIG